MKALCCLSMVGLLITSLFANRVGADDRSSPDLEQTIEYLIGYVSGSGLQFIRNGEKHDAPSAAAHIQSKYSRAKSSIRTPEEFIEKCASKSMLSGSDYIVI